MLVGVAVELDVLYEVDHPILELLQGLGLRSVSWEGGWELSGGESEGDLGGLARPGRVDDSVDLPLNFLVSDQLYTYLYPSKLCQKLVIFVYLHINRRQLFISVTNRLDGVNKKPKERDNESSLV